MSCDGRKWECQYCTYLNWLSAIKCTMCRSPKPLQVIEEGAPPPVCSISVEDSTNITLTSNSQNATWDPLASSETQGACKASLIESSLGAGSIEPNYITNKVLDTKTCNLNSPLRLEQYGNNDIRQIRDKWNWTCPTCDTLNWTSSTSCPHCSAKCPEFLENTAEETSIPTNFQQPLKISDLAKSLGYKDSPKRTNGPPTPSPAKSPSHPRGAEKCVSRSSPPSSASNAGQEKWSCSVCTYDNWPRSTKCVMCNSSRPTVSDQSLPLRGTAERSSGSIHSRSDVESVMTPSLANLSLDVSNNRCQNLESSRLEDNAVNTNYADPIRMRLFHGDEMDRRWLEACCGVVDGNVQAVEEYLSAGGDPTRQLTEAEVIMLDRPSAFDIGFTLIHLALRFHQEDVLATLLTQVDGNNQPIVKRVPSYAAPTIALEIRRHVMSSIRPRKGSLRCNFTSEIQTFTLPSEIEDFSPETQETLFDELLDRDVQKELENGQIINWSIEVAEQLNSRLYALWNRSAGDCLLDSVLQATWGIFDRDNGLRRALADSLHDCATQFYQRWKESELLHARHLNFSLNEAQCSNDWAKLLSLASQPGSSLEQLHIFALAHILRRPIIVYGVKYVKSFRGEALGFARYEGVYLPLLWEPSFCWKWPIALGYTRGHFSALVPMEPDCDPLARVGSGAQAEDINERSTYLPLTTVDGMILPVQFLTQSEIGKEEFILNQWLDVSFTERGVMVARQRIQKRPMLVTQMVEEWLNYYRRLGEITAGPYKLRQSTATCYSSEGESDND